MAAELTEGSAEFWRKKCGDQEYFIKTLTEHCVKVIKKHEEVLAKYQSSQKKNVVLTERLKMRKEQVEKVREVVGSVTREYQELREKYEIAQRCQQEAEMFATNVNNKNKNLKRQSNMIMTKLSLGQNITDIDFSEVDTEKEVDEDQKKYYESLEQKIKDLSASKATLSASVKMLTEDLDIANEKNNELKKRLEEYKIQLKNSNDRVSKQEMELTQLANTSEKALKEYRSLQDQYEKEMMNAKASEHIARQLKAESKAYARQSAALMSNISSDEKYLNALSEAQELTTELETVRGTLQDKIASLEQQLQEEKERSGLKAMEEENASLMEERDQLLQKLTDAEKASIEANTQNVQLQEKYSELQVKYDKVLTEPRVPAPPPPPPPPPPPARTGILAMIAGNKKKQKEIKRKRLEKGGASDNQDWNKALQEMMDRINRGAQLRPVLHSRTQSLPEENSKISELEGILKKMKRARSEEDLTAAEDPFVDKDSEFGQTFQKILQKKQSIPSPKPTPFPRKLSVQYEDKEEEEEGS